jgi:UDP-N-acetylmuramoyl-tripeptide--D-alanyl-D-alanine ligase
MIPIPIADLAVVLGARVVSDRGAVAVSAGQPVDVTGFVTHVMTDSRAAPEGPAVFFALATERADGHTHVGAAFEAGAAVAVVDRVVDGAAGTQLVVDDTWVALATLGRHVVDVVGCRVVAITGSYGKTTVKDLSAAAIAAGRRVTASRASFNNELGVPLTMLSVDVATQVLVAEAGARGAGDMQHLGALLAPDVAVVTAVGPVHLETFGDEDGVAAEKSQLVRALGPTGTAVLNADDVRVAAMAHLAPAALMVSPSGGRAEVRAEQVSLDDGGRVAALARTPWGDVSIALPVPGAHHLTNALLALAVACVEGVDLADAAAGLSTAATSPSRSQLLRAGGVTVLDDAYNASLPTMLGALRTLGALPCAGRRWAVLGEMAELGPTSEAQHRAVGRACTGLEELVVVGEAAGAIAAGAREVAPRTRIRAVADHVAAAALVAEEVAAGDVVLFKASRVATLDRAAASVVAALGGAEAA